MFIRVWYTMHDGGDGSASVRYHTNEDRAEAALKRDPDSAHLNDYGVQNTFFEVSDFDILESIPFAKNYRGKNDPGEFEDWFDEQEFETSDDDDWESIWNSLISKGVKDPSKILDEVIQLVRNDYGD